MAGCSQLIYWQACRPLSSREINDILKISGWYTAMTTNLNYFMPFTTRNKCTSRDIMFKDVYFLML